MTRIAKGKVGTQHRPRQADAAERLRFESLAEAQTYLDHREERWADPRIHGTAKRQVAAMLAEERSSLLPLPLEPFRYYQYGERTVHLSRSKRRTTARHRAGSAGECRCSGTLTTFACSTRAPVSYSGSTCGTREAAAGSTTKTGPKKTPLSTHQLLARADRTGAQIGVLCRGMHQTSGEPSVRQILGVLSLVKKYGGATVEDACATALEMGAGHYRFVRRYLERQAPPSLSLRQIDPLIRQLELYRDLIEAKTKENVIELERSLRQLRLGLDNFDFNFNPKMKRSLIIDDFGMRKLPLTAAEDLLEIIIRRYERASTLLTSNRPVEDWGKLLGDVAAVTAMLDRLLHHGQVLKRGPPELAGENRCRRGREQPVKRTDNPRGSAPNPLWAAPLRPAKPFSRGRTQQASCDEPGNKNLLEGGFAS